MERKCDETCNNNKRIDVDAMFENLELKDLSTESP